MPKGKKKAEVVGTVEAPEVVTTTTEGYDVIEMDTIAPDKRLLVLEQSVKEDVEEVVPHTVTEEDLSLNPELEEAGVEIGEEIGLPVETEVESVEELDTKIEEALKEAKTSFDVLNSSGGYVRTYSVELHGENAEALAHQYAGKVGGTVK
jgi:hypothetical protein